MSIIEKDPVNSPPHYRRGDIECIDAMRACSTPEEFIGYLKLTTLKYLWRIGAKDNDLEDAKKAQWYLRQLIRHLPEPKEENKI